MKSWGYVALLLSLLTCSGYAQTAMQKPLAESLETVPVRVQDYLYWVSDYINQYKYGQASLWLEKTAGLYPKEQGRIGEIYLSRLHDYPCALHYFNAYDALTPGFNDIISNSPVSYLRGLAYRYLDDHYKAIEQFSAGIDALESRHGAEWVNYRHFVSRAISYLATQQPEKALIDLEKAGKNFSRSALVPYYRAVALLQVCRVSEARTAFQDASFFYKALRYERAGDYQEDTYNPLYEADIDNALIRLKPKP